MKLQKFFAREKSKPTKVIPIGRDSDAAIIDEETLLQSPPSQPRDQPRSIARASNEEHWEVLQQGPGEDVIRVPSPRALQQHFIAPVIPSRSSSLNSGSSPQMQSTMVPMPRSSSPFSISSTNASLQGIRSQRSDAQALRKKSPPAQGGHVALGILKALEPHQDLAPPPPQQELYDDYQPYSEPVRVDKDKKKGFWDGMLRDRDRDRSKADRDRERERERGRERERERFERARDRDRHEDDFNNTAELTRMIGFLTATSSEDWSIVMEVSERASASEANAREAARALRREFKYAEPKAQLAAARLWAIMLRNASDVFIHQISQRKFIEVLEDVLTSPRTSPVVRERLMEVLAAAAFITSTRTQPGSRDKDKDGFRSLWCRLKPADKPDAGVPFDTDDVMFSPPFALPRPVSQYSLETPTFAQQFSREDLSPTPPPMDHPFPQKGRRLQQQRVIPPEEDIRRLFQECKIARGNADLLTQTLAFAKPDALDAGLIPEFFAKCRASQELIYTQIPWASAGAERSRAERALFQQTRIRSVTHGSQQDLSVANTEDVPDELTVEEELLAALLDANEALVAALRMYDDLARVATERAAEEKSRKDIRMDRRQLDSENLVEPQGPYTGGSAPSPPPPPLPSPTLRQPFEMPVVVPSANHPLPRIPPTLLPSTPTLNHHSSHHQFGSQTNTPTLLVPQHPLGPRSPAQIIASSRTPSPDQISHPSRQDSMDSGKEHISDDIERMNIEDSAYYSDEEVFTPTRPSAKSLGKRRVVEDPEDSETGTVSFGQEDFYRDQAPDSDSDDVGFMPKRQPTRYVYDAAAERTAQHLRDGQINVMVNGD